MRTRIGVITLACLVLAATATRATAQSFSYGVKAGISFADQSFDPDKAVLDASPRPAFVAGALIDFGLFRSLALQAEVLYSMRVTRFEGGFVQDTLTYIEVPVLLRHPVRRTPGWVVHALGGVVLARRLRARESFGNDSEDIKNLIEPNDRAAAVGASLESGQKWLVDFRYLHGLSEIYSGAGPAVSARQKVIQITAGYRFR